MSPVRSASGFAAVAFAFAVVMAGTTIPTPLYALYSAELGFTVFTLTIVFSAYAIGVIAALIAFGRWSDVVGRRPLLLAGVALSAVSAVVFLTAGPVSQLIVGRVLSGLSAGIYVGTATAAIIELAPESWKHRAPAVATAANIGGLGVGPLVTGFLAEYGPSPLHTPFVLNLAVLIVAGIGIWFIPEPVAVRSGRLSIQPLSLPREVRGVFTRAAIGAAAGFAVMGSFTSVSPSFVSKILGFDNHALAGCVVATLLAFSTISQLAARRVPTQPAMIIGCALLVLGTTVLIGALTTRSLSLMLVGAATVGVGQGLSFSKGLAALVEVCPADRRAEVTSAYFVVAFLAISFPVVGQGFAAATWGLYAGGLILDIAAAALSLLALVSTVIASRRRHESEPGGAHDPRVPAAD
ncbi:MFS transporter [Antrihabitans stalactiti]|uniref:MFS transporter n=1 Tax=Antrihabitans stalactiti TaxID=2584121 RepID=A0A848KA29_9NOCA|nr:MFS transporter [Antrihabitans stalactiti]NMN95673.1 MFS transporter [Antrihabitans stalactiti]